MKDYNKATIKTTVIFTAIQAFIIAGYVMKSKFNNIIEVITITFLFLLYSFLKTKYDWHMDSYITVNVVLSVFGHLLIGEYFEVYESSVIFDKLLHAYGIFSFSLFFYSLLNQLFPSLQCMKAREFILIVMLGISLGAFFEIIEFLVDTIFKPAIPAQDDLLDTDLDIIFDITGALIAAFYLYKKKLCKNS